MAYSSIVKPSVYFNTVTYTGNGSSPRSITGVGFQPDLNWTKCRSAGGSHVLANAVSGANKQLVSNNANAEATNGTYGYLSAFDSDGWSMTTGSNDFSRMNTNSATYASWNWKANGAGSSNTDGDVTSTVSANTTAGFSIVKWDSTGTVGINIGHGLGQKPAMIIAKCLNQSSTSWPVYHQSLGATKYLSLQGTNAVTTSATRWNNSEPTTTTFQTGSSGDIGGSDRTMIAYCFANKTGFSKFGSYTGNGSSDGPFVYTGFKPAFIIAKRTDSTSEWYMFDNKREGYNPSNDDLFANLSDAEVSGNDRLDILSNGFKFKTSNTDNNASGGTYIYMSFAEQPLVANSGTDGVPATAR